MLKRLIELSNPLLNDKMLAPRGLVREVGTDDCPANKGRTLRHGDPDPY